MLIWQIPLVFLFAVRPTFDAACCFHLQGPQLYSALSLVHPELFSTDIMLTQSDEILSVTSKFNFSYSALEISFSFALDLFGNGLSKFELL